ncbi:MAG: ABC transporter substrate-binding protein [Desulfurococcales archaeon]|nr:ABC transporter substrate-binding protein [Desulfurococcales archaeon]
MLQDWDNGYKLRVVLLFLALIIVSQPILLGLHAFAEEEIVLRVITRHPGEITKKAKEEFLKSDIAKKYNIKDVKFISYDPTQWVVAINRTYKPGKSGFDVAWGGGPTLFDTLYEAGLLAPLESPEVLEAVSQIPDTFAGSPMKRVSDGKVYWVAASVASFGFTVNHDLLKKYNLPVPKRWSDLASHVFAKTLITENKPMVAIADPTRSTSNTRMYEIILQAYGWDNGWVNLTLLAANSLVEGGSSDVRDDVIQGRVAVGITIDFYGYTAMQANPACEYILPEGESIVNGDPIALLKTSIHKEAAQAFITWVLTEGQKVWFDPNINRLPSNPNAFNLPEGKERQDLKQVYESLKTAKPIQFNDTLALMYEKAMQIYFKSVLVDLNSLLKEVWKRLVKLYNDGYISKEEFREYSKKLGSPLKYTDPYTGEEVVFTLENAIKVTKKLKDPKIMAEATTKYSVSWREAATNRYQAILSELEEIERTRTPGAAKTETTSPQTTPHSPTTPVESPTTAPQKVTETETTTETTTTERTTETTTGGAPILPIVAIIAVLVILAVILRKR